MNGDDLHLLCPRFVAAFICLLGLAVPRADAGGDVADHAIQVQCRTVDGKITGGRLLRFDFDQGAAIEVKSHSEPECIPAEDIIAMRWMSEGQPPDDGAFVFSLAGGDRIVGQPVGGDDEHVLVASPVLGRVRVELLRVAGLRRLDHGAKIDLETPQWRRDNAESDRIRLTNGDLVEGIVARIDASTITIHIGDQVQTVDLSQVDRIILQGAERAGRNGLHAICTMRDGSRSTVSSADINERRAALVFRGQDLSIDPRQMVTLEMANGRWTPLATLEPVRTEQTPMMSLSWPHRVDRCVTGSPMRTADQEFSRGIGVHSRSLLAFELDGRYSEFVTQFGLDDTAGSLADVEVVVLVDGSPRFEAHVDRTSGLHPPIRIPTTGARRLELLVDVGSNATVGDRFNWIEPGLVR